jgi:alpha/beta superfamily hydrolase
MPEEKVFHRTLFLPGPAGRLEALLWTSPDGRPALTALVCHPHPLYGGTMHNKVVFQTARALHELGLPVLRFNFRGTGLSEGSHDKGQGEQDDVRAALGYLVEEFPDAPVILAGFSFGAWVGLRVGCQDGRVSDLIGLGLPVNNLQLEYLRSCTKPKLFLQGTKDKFGARERVEALVEAMPVPKQLVFVDGVDHFFTGKLHEVSRAITAWMKAGHPDLEKPGGNIAI